MTKSKHTITPWHYQENSDKYTHIVRDSRNGIVSHLSQETSGISEANARHIVKCVNMHDEMLDALIFITKDVQFYKNSPSLKMLNKIIKKAKGES